MIVELPEWQPYASGENPWTPEATERGRVVVAWAPAPASREQWSPDIVFDLLEAWSEAGHRVVLADCVLEHPMLHRKAGLANEEGLVDAALFGASVSRIARSIPGRSFFFVGTGSPAGDPEAVLSTARLGRLQDGFREAGVTFVAFVRQGCAGEAMLVGAADDLLILAQNPEDMPDGVRGSADKVRAVVGPAAEEPTPTGAALAAEQDAMPDLDVNEPVQDEGALSDAPSPGTEDTFAWAESTQDDAESAREAAAIGAAPEAEMDFSAPDGTQAPDDAGPQHEDGGAMGPGGDLHGSEAGPVAQASPRRAPPTADSDAHRKLLWLLLAVLILVVLVLLGALG